jgi:hypothetical protein
MLLLLGILVALFLNFTALCVVIYQHARARKAAAATEPAASIASAAAPDPIVATEGHVRHIPGKMEWHEAPIVASVGGDDTEDVIGQVSTVGEDGQMTYYVGAFDGTTFEQLWRSPSLAVLERGERPPIVHMVADHVIVAESNSVHIDDPTTGNETGTVRTTDRIVDICPYGPEKARVWAKVADGRSVAIDPQNAESKPLEQPPAGCEARGKTKLDAPTVSGFSPSKVLIEGDVAVALGVKSPGSPIPMASGFDPKSRKVRWTHPIAQSDDVLNVITTSGRIADLSDGRLYATYRLSSAGWQLAAIDGKSGERVWDAAIPDGNAGIGTITVSPARVYLAHATWLDVFDKASGKRIGTIGDHVK